MTTLTSQRLSARRMIVPSLAVAAFASLMMGAVAFDQGALAGVVTNAMSDNGGVLHELFHDARHLLGVPCH